MCVCDERAWTRTYVHVASSPGHSHFFNDAPRNIKKWVWPGDEATRTLEPTSSHLLSVYIDVYTAVYSMLCDTVEHKATFRFLDTPASNNCLLEFLQTIAAIVFIRQILTAKSDDHGRENAGLQDSVCLYHHNRSMLAGDFVM